MNVHSLQKHLEFPTLITQTSMLHYLLGTSFDVGERFIGLLLTQNSAQLFLNRLFPCDLKGVQIIRFDDTEDVMALLAKELVGPHLMVDGYLRSKFLIALMHHRPDLRLSLDHHADYVRAIKSPVEIKRMKEASRINDLIMDKVRQMIRPRMREQEIAQFIATQQQLHNVTPSFPTIVAFGEHAADPHAQPGERILNEREAILIDMGCVHEGYCSDMTRTFYHGYVDLKLYNLVLKANLAAIQAIKPGVRFCDIDEAARKVIRDAGYGDAFIHRTGHGVGQEVHEPYDVSASNTREVEADMIFSIEPGIYLPEKTGVRIEDLVLVTQEGCEVLNHHPKDQPILL